MSRTRRRRPQEARGSPASGAASPAPWAAVRRRHD